MSSGPYARPSVSPIQSVYSHKPLAVITGTVVNVQRDFFSLLLFVLFFCLFAASCEGGDKIPIEIIVAACASNSWISHGGGRCVT